MKKVAGWCSFEALRRFWGPEGGIGDVPARREVEEGWVGAELGSGSAST